MSELIIIGGGFAGVKAALSAAYENKENGGDVLITLISQNDFLVIRPRLYQSHPEKMKVPLEPILAAVGVNFVHGTVNKIDPQQRSVVVNITKVLELTVDYDRLILAAGSVLDALPIPGFNAHSWNIDTYEAAIDFDNHLLKMARFPNHPGHNRFIILGGGITGIELAAELRSRIELHSNPATAAAIEIILTEQDARLGPADNAAEEIIAQALQTAKVTIRLNCTITNITPTGVTLGKDEIIEAASVITTTGLRANPLADLLASAANITPDKLGRLPVDSALKVKGVKNIFAAGDIAAAQADDTHLALMSCQHAMPMGAHAGYNAVHSLLSLPHRKYHQPDYVTCIDLGESGALFTKGWNGQVAMTGSEAKRLKQKINEEMIYPPEGAAETILAKSHIEARWGSDL